MPRPAAPAPALEPNILLWATIYARNRLVQRLVLYEEDRVKVLVAGCDCATLPAAKAHTAVARPLRLIVGAVATVFVTNASDMYCSNAAPRVSVLMVTYSR